MKQYWSNALKMHRYRGRLRTRTGPVLALCAALYFLLSPNSAFAFLFVCCQTDLDFGTAAGDADLSGTIILDTANLASFTGGAYNMGGGQVSGTFFRGSNEPYTCTVPASITLTGPGTDMTVDGFTAAPGWSSAGGFELLSVGATLHMAAAQAAGAYSGDLTLICIADDGNPIRNSTTTVLVTLLAPISISNTLELAFGAAAPTGVGGTITVAPDSGRTAANVDLMGGTVGAASFTVGGEANTGYTITLPGTLTITDGGGNSMDVDTWTTAPTSPATLSGAPPDTVTVGATLNVGASQAPGVYSGTFSVTAEYN